ncbi:secretion protein EspA [Enterobacterales bacterium CwR94]|nr:secretion protein EspA [Enterobacterales bacterium CwR94]
MTTINGNDPLSRMGGNDNNSRFDLLSNPNPLGDSIAVMMLIMDLISRQTNDKLDSIKSKSDVSRDAQDMANRVEAELAKLIKDGDKGTLPEDVLKYLKDNNILIGGKTIDEFMEGKDGKLDKADLMTIKSALESTSGRASDFVQQNQLKMQQLIQNYNTAVQMINSLQSMLAESTKGIASAIR